MPPAPPASISLPVVVLVSGHGSNLQAILDQAPALGVEVRAVISDRADALALERARAAGIRTETLPASSHPDRDAYDAALASSIQSYSPGLVVLAGFMRILGPGFVRAHAGRLINIHPSLLPKYRGLHTHRRALAAGERVHGCSVHFVTEELDGGAVIAQAEVPVRPDDTEMTLRARVQRREHRLYPEVIGWFAAGRVGVRGNQAWFDGAPLHMPRIFPWDEREHA